MRSQTELEALRRKEEEERLKKQEEEDHRRIAVNFAYSETHSNFAFEILKHSYSKSIIFENLNREIFQPL